jgi:hypothetical protein|tara:strand:+ start:422 stop:751 length:330 start_codon:yes stop_codon:yes gene_type:complete
MTDYKRHPGYKHGSDGKPKKVSPYDDAQRVLNKGYQCQEIKDAMTMVTEDVLNNLFLEWLETKHYETERREFIYKLAISQGAVMSNIDKAITAKDNKTQQVKNAKENDE